jgi:pimeloyl-ACP methyl ester carboxylesterase
MFPQEHGLVYQQSIPGAKLVIVPQCGHLPHIEKPDAFTAEIEAFCGAQQITA